MDHCKKEVGKMRSQVAGVLIICAAAVALSVETKADQAAASSAGASLASAYKLVDWPAPATSACGRAPT